MAQKQPSKCMKCDKPWTHKVTKIVNNQIQEFFLCDDHAREFSAHLPNPENKIDQAVLMEMFHQLLQQQAGASKSSPDAAPSRNCPSCGLSLDAYRKTLLLGCSDCYEAFEDILVDDLRKIHGATCQNPDQEPIDLEDLDETDLDILDELTGEVEAETEPPEHPSIQESFAHEMAGSLPETDLDNPEDLLILKKEKLRQAIDEENFEAATVLRDEIRGLEKKLKSS